MSIDHLPSTPLVDALRRNHGLLLPVEVPSEAQAPQPGGGGPSAMFATRPRSRGVNIRRSLFGHRGRRFGVLLLTFAAALALATFSGSVPGLLNQADTTAIQLAAQTNPAVTEALGTLGFGRVRQVPGQPPICETARPIFVYGFADLKARVGGKMGEPLECERAIHPSGDTNQRTTMGLAYYRKGVNIPTFTNGSEHWALTTQGLVYWIGDVVDPPVSASEL
jgi:hypothetical protein